LDECAICRSLRGGEGLDDRSDETSRNAAASVSRDNSEGCQFDLGLAVVRFTGRVLDAGGDVSGDGSDNGVWLAREVGDKASARGVEEVLAEEGAVIDVGQEVGLWQ
jgi:hypothetical protein